MQKYALSQIEAGRAWSGPDIAHIPNAVVKLRWTDEPFRWHANVGAEVFCVLEGTVDMHVRREGTTGIIVLHAGDVLHVQDGEEHVAHPRGPARLLVVEQVAGR